MTVQILQGTMTGSETVTFGSVQSGDIIIVFGGKTNLGFNDEDQFPAGWLTAGQVGFDSNFQHGFAMKRGTAADSGQAFAITAFNGSEERVSPIVIRGALNWGYGGGLGMRNAVTTSLQVVPGGVAPFSSWVRYSFIATDDLPVGVTGSGHLFSNFVPNSSYAPSYYDMGAVAYEAFRAAYTFDVESGSNAGDRIPNRWVWPYSYATLSDQGAGWMYFSDAAPISRVGVPSACYTAGFANSGTNVLSFTYPDSVNVGDYIIAMIYVNTYNHINLIGSANTWDTGSWQLLRSGTTQVVNKQLVFLGKHVAAGEAGAKPDFKAYTVTSNGVAMTAFVAAFTNVDTVNPVVFNAAFNTTRNGQSHRGFDILPESESLCAAFVISEAGATDHNSVFYNTRSLLTSPGTAAYYVSETKGAFDNDGTYKFGLHVNTQLGTYVDTRDATNGISITDDMLPTFFWLVGPGSAATAPPSMGPGGAVTGDFIRLFPAPNVRSFPLGIREFPRA